MKESASGHHPVGVEARLRLTFSEPSMISFALALIGQDIQQEDFGICPLVGPCFSIQRNFWEMQWSLWHVPLPHSSQQALCAKFCGHSTGPF